VADTSVAAESITSRTAIGAGWMIAWRMVTRSLGLLSTIILARLLVPADFGLVAIATTFAAAVDSMSELGLSSALVRQADCDPETLDTAFTIQLIRGLLSATIITVGATWATEWFGDPRLMPLLLILAAVAAVSGLDNIAVVRFQRDLRFDMEFRLLFMPRILQFVIATASAIMLRSYWSLIIGIVVGRVARTITTYRMQPHRPRLGLSRWRDLATFSAWSWASSMVYIVWNRCDAFVLGPVWGSGPLGVYLLTTEIGLLPTTELVEPVSRALYAGVAAARNRGTDPFGMAVPLMAALLTVVLPVGLGISATSGYVVAGLLGPAWEVGQPVIAVSAMMCLITPVTFVANTVLNASGHVRQNFNAVAFASVTRVAAVYAVAGYQRLDYAAMAIFGVLTVEASLFVWQLSGRGSLRWRESLPGLGRTFLACAVTAAILWTTGLGWRPVHMASVPALLTGGAIGLLCIGCAAGTQLGLWLLSGRPAGPEATLLDTADGLFSRFRRRWGRG
jgi:O-antigen/teichoic acid export membrane protein